MNTDSAPKYKFSIIFENLKSIGFKTPTVQCLHTSKSTSKTLCTVKFWKSDTNWVQNSHCAMFTLWTTRTTLQTVHISKTQCTVHRTDTNYGYRKVWWRSVYLVQYRQQHQTMYIVSRHFIGTLMLQRTLSHHDACIHHLNTFKVEKILKSSLDSIPSPSTSVKIQIFAWGVNVKHCWVLSTNCWKQKVCWHHPAMFCLSWQ